MSDEAQVVQFDCPHCGVTIEADAVATGGRAHCPDCREPVMVPAAGIHEGSVLGGYRIERLLGTGAMGQVYLATQLSMDRPVALKVLSPGLTRSRGYLDRFRQEVRLLGRIDHPNIVCAYEAGDDRGTCFFAMSYVDGENLDDLLEANGPFAEEEVFTIAIQVARALVHAWSRYQLLHRDIKPSNIMLDEAGEVMLMDLGISKRVNESAKMTQAGTVVGTPYYMSPEQATGEEKIDFRSDMYSLGATLYHLLGGAVPFDGTTSMEVLTKVLTDTPKPLRELNREVSATGARLVQRMMERRPEKRFATWEELIAACKAHLTKLPAERAKEAARPLPVAVPVVPVAVAAPPRWRWSRTTVSIAVLLTLLLLELLALVLFTPRETVADESGPDRQAAAPPVVAAEKRAPPVKETVRQRWPKKP